MEVKEGVKEDIRKKTITISRHLKITFDKVQKGKRRRGIKLVNQQCLSACRRTGNCQGQFRIE